MKTLRFLSIQFLIITCCNLVAANESSWSIEASFYENATWKKIWIMRIGSDGNAHLSSINDPLKRSDRIKIERKLTEQENTTILALIEYVENSELKDVFPEYTMTDGPIFFIKISKNEKMLESASMNIGSPDQSKERTQFIKVWKVISEIFPSNAPLPENYEYKN